MNILGINSVYHESAAALLVDGVLVAAVEEERFNRIKHGKSPNVDNPHQLPEQAIRFCLDHAGLSADDIDHVAYSFDPQQRRKRYRAEWWPDPRLEEVFLLRLAEVRGAVERFFRRPLRQRFHFVPHHLAHAASAYFPSGFDRAAILTIDGLGEASCSMLGKAVGNKVQEVETFYYPHSLGFMWEHFSMHLGFEPHDASKVMGLAAYGNSDAFRDQFRSIIRTGKEDYAVDPEVFGFQSATWNKLETVLGPPRFPGEKILPRHADIAAALQASTNAAVAALVRRLKRKVPFDNLCIAGGVALNCVTNELVRQSGAFANVFIPSAPHDGGTAVGAALLVHCAKAKSHPERGNSTPFLGPGFDRREILAAVKLAGLEHRRSKSPARDAAKMIADGKIVAWFQGRMEFGPRALGNRSILARPDGDRIKDRINSAVKFREAFRPFAPAVHIDDRDRLFVTRGFDPDLYMLATAQVRPEARATLSGIVHEDDSARIQTVTPELNPAFAELLAGVRERTGTGCVVNTSFNVKGQPLIMDPETAIDTFSRIALDRLYIEGFVVEPTTIIDPPAPVPGSAG